MSAAKSALNHSLGLLGFSAGRFRVALPPHRGSFSILVANITYSYSNPASAARSCRSLANAHRWNALSDCRNLCPVWPRAIQAATSQRVMAAARNSSWTAYGVGVERLEEVEAVRAYDGGRVQKPEREG